MSRASDVSMVICNVSALNHRGCTAYLFYDDLWHTLFVDRSHRRYLGLENRLLRKHAHAINRELLWPCRYSLEPPWQGEAVLTSNEYPQSMIWSKNKKNIKNFLLKIFIFLLLKNSLYIAWACFHIMICFQSKVFAVSGAGRNMVTNA